MYTESITSYCVRYDPYKCGLDPQRIWSVIASLGGSCHWLPLGRIDFYVPRQVIVQIMLMDSALRIIESNSWI